jgi:outer membrane protein OmpA-like peptidoglycan-associated protein
MRRAIKRIVHVSLALSILTVTSACVVSPDETPEPDATDITSDPSQEHTEPAEGEQEVIASTTSTSTTLGSDLQINVHALETVNNGLLRLRFEIENKSPENFFLYSGLSDTDNLHSASQVTLIDSINQNRHLSYKQTDGACLCSAIEGTIASGQSVDMWVIFPAPDASVESMTITTPMTPPILDVPISESTETVENSGLSEPEIIPLTMISDNIEDQTGRTESNDEVSIILSSDVLFATGSSDLNSDAEEILAQVATEIDDASSSAVSIDGYADNTGNESINVPLSQERAESVESALSDLITRSGIEFETNGHGSSDPIATNDTEEGRERNRRVSVTFEK